MSFRILCEVGFAIGEDIWNVKKKQNKTEIKAEMMVEATISTAL